MSSRLPERASLEYLKKLAKDRLQELRRVDPRAKLAAALLAVARDHGFPSWRALKTEIEQRQTRDAARFFAASAQGDVETLRGLLAGDPGLVRIRASDRLGGTGLHAVAQGGHAAAVRLLLEHGADPNARDAGDHAYALHFAAGSGHLETVRALLDAGGDVHGLGDLHELDVIGWAALWAPDDRRANVLSLLIERGARHHIVSAIAAGDLELIQTLVEQNPEALDRRLSRFEHRQTPLHFAMNRNRYDILDLLIDLGADLEAEDGNGQTAMAVAMLRGDREAMNRLHAAGAKPPAPAGPSSSRADLAKLAGSIKKGVPMITVPDIAATLDWYASIGFQELGRYGENGVANWGMMSFGNVEIMLRPGETKDPSAVSLWLYTDGVESLYHLLKSRQLHAAQAMLAGEPAEPAEPERIEFVEDLYEPFYGGREFGIRDLNGYHLFFLQPGEG